MLSAERMLAYIRIPLDGWCAEFKRVIELPRPLTEWDTELLTTATDVYP